MAARSQNPRPLSRSALRMIAPLEKSRVVVPGLRVDWSGSKSLFFPNNCPVVLVENTVFSCSCSLASLSFWRSWVKYQKKGRFAPPLIHPITNFFGCTCICIDSPFLPFPFLGATYQVSTYLLYRFQWTTTQLSNVGTIQGLSRLVALTVLLPFVKRFSPRASASDPAASISFDLKVVVIGLFIEALTYFLYGATIVGEGFYVGGATGAVGSLFFPAIRGVLSQAVSPEMLGRTLGTLATFESLAAVLAPSLGAWFYAVTLKTHPSAVFYAASAMAMASTLLAALVLFSHTRELRSRR